MISKLLVENKIYIVEFERDVDTDEDIKKELEGYDILDNFNTNIYIIQEK